MRSSEIMSAFFADCPRAQADKVRAALKCAETGADKEARKLAAAVTNSLSAVHRHQLIDSIDSLRDANKSREA